MVRHTPKLLGTVAFLALLAPALASAQTSPGGVSSVQGTSASGGPQASSDISDDTAIIVTAQRREENLKDVPIAVTVLDGNTLEKANITSTLDIGIVTPGLNMAVNGGFANPTIRGIGTTVTAAGADANVSVYVDGVYRPNQLGNLFDLNNIYNIQVLKGPQGTLFGRNATGGAILVTTLEPQFTPELKLSASYGSFDEVKIAAYANKPLTDTLAFNVAASYHDDDGYQFNEATNNRVSEATSRNVRAKLLWEAASNFKINLVGYYSQSQDSAFQARQALDGNNSIRQTQPNFPLETEFGVVALDTDPNVSVENYGGSLTLALDVAGGTLKSISSWEYIDPRSLVDVDGTSLPNSTTRLAYPEETIIQELTYATDFDGPINFLLGAFYYDDTVKRTLRTSRGLTGPITSGNNIRVDTKAYALFGELNYDITERLNLILGVRYSSEKKHVTGSPLSGIQSLDAREKWTAATPRVALTYKVSDTSTLYASYSRGFKSGAFDSNLTPSPVDPEYINAYEVGFKHFDHRFRFETSAYYYDYSDLQVQVSSLQNGAVTPLLRNASDAEIYGIEANLWADISENFSLQVGGNYTHGRYKSFPGAVLTAPRAGGGNIQFSGDASGNEIIRTPEFTAFAVASYHQAIRSGTIDFSVTPSYNGPFYWDPGNFFRQESRILVNAEFAWTSLDEQIRLSLWGKNLTDEHYPMTLGLSTGGASIAYARPRTVGVSATLKF